MSDEKTNLVISTSGSVMGGAFAGAAIGGFAGAAIGGLVGGLAAAVANSTAFGKDDEVKNDTYRQNIPHVDNAAADSNPNRYTKC